MIIDFTFLNSSAKIYLIFASFISFFFFSSSFSNNSFFFLVVFSFSFFNSSISFCSSSNCFCSFLNSIKLFFIFPISKNKIIWNLPSLILILFLGYFNIFEYYFYSLLLLISLGLSLFCFFIEYIFYS